MSEPILRTKNLKIGYRNGFRQEYLVACDLQLEVHAGSLVCLIGPNGTGKSTLLRTLSRTQFPLDGEIDLLGKNLLSLTETEIARSLSIVLTKPVTIGNMRVDELIGMGRFPFTNFFDRRNEYDQQITDEAMRTAKVWELRDRYVAELSDGERQRVMIARALAQEPKLLILDEPTAFLDLPGRVNIMRMLKQLAHEQGKAVLSSTHDLDLALQSADWIWLMDREGVLRQGAPEDLVLRGDLGNTFNRQGVSFDPNSGQFKLDEELHRPIILRGEGMEKFWTQRALIRAGFDVVETGNTSLPLIQTHTDGNRRYWTCKQNGREVSHASIYSLISSLKE